MDNQMEILIVEFIINTLLYKFVINCKIDGYTFRKEISGQWELALNLEKQVQPNRLQFFNRIE